MTAVTQFLTSRVTQTICALGLTQIISWGTTLYALGVLGKPIAADTGWSQTLVFGGLTVGLLTSSLISTFIGKLIDVRGGRVIMSIGTALLSAGLVILSQVEGPLTYLAAWAFLGVGMRMTLYDAAFPSLVQVMPSQGRRAISFLTLYGWFASSVLAHRARAQRRLRLANHARDIRADQHLPHLAADVVRAALARGGARRRL